LQPVSKEQVIHALESTGLQAGDGLLVHSAIQFLGKPTAGVGMYLEALCEVINCDPEAASQPASPPQAGTLAVPAFNFAFARGEPYDPHSTPSQGMGSFSEYVRQLPGAQRTPHPMQSLAIIGRYADELTGRDTPSAFDPGSAFERMFELDFKLLLLGADVQAVSMVHYSEQRASVPYRYWKDFTGQVKTASGWQTRTYRMFVRDLELDPQLNLHPIQGLMEQRSQWRSVPINYGQIASCRLVDFVAAADELLAANPWALVD